MYGLGFITAVRAVLSTPIIRNNGAKKRRVCEDGRRHREPQHCQSPKDRCTVNQEVDRYHSSDNFSNTSFLAKTREHSSQRSLLGSIVSLYRSSKTSRAF
jgi:hypothetical protein